MELLLLFWIVCGVAAAIVMSNKGRSGCAGLALGFFFGPLGLLVAMVLSSDQSALEREEVARGNMRKCYFCAEMIKAEASRCRYCHSDIEPLA